MEENKLQFNSLSYDEKVKLIKSSPVQLYKGETLIKLFYKSDNQTRLLVLQNSRNLFYYVLEQLIVFNEEQFKQVNEGFPDVIFGAYQQVDNGYGYSVFESVEHLLKELEPELIMFTEEKIK